MLDPHCELPAQDVNVLGVIADNLRTRDRELWERAGEKQGELESK